MAAIRTRACALGGPLVGPLLVAGFLGLGLVTGGCTVGYLFHVGKGQLRIVCGSRSTEAVLRDAEVPESVKKKIRLVLDAKAFGEAELGLAPSKNYTRYYMVKHPPVAYNLTASPRFDIEAYAWCFPVAGCLPYKGFFARERAERDSARMSRRGYDTYIRPVGAYSTLGWFRDPIFSTMLRYPDPVLVEVILHEMVHGTIFLKGQGAFNEGVATFVGEKGAEAFFRSRGGLTGEQSKEMARRRRANGLFQKTMSSLAERLRVLYRSEGEEEAKLARRVGIFAEAKESLRKGLEALGSKGYQGVLDEDWNNAFLVSYLTYHEDAGLWEALYDSFGRDLELMVGWLRQFEGEKDPIGRIEGRLARCDGTVDH